eukprot:m.110150 g.110150  ORF g.110150 m.110150 type:complete len:149 (+) comp15362_c0_seq14:79-525(+)
MSHPPRPPFVKGCIVTTDAHVKNGTKAKNSTLTTLKPFQALFVDLPAIHPGAASPGATKAESSERDNTLAVNQDVKPASRLAEGAFPGNAMLSESPAEVEPEQPKEPIAPLSKAPTSIRYGTSGRPKGLTATGKPIGAGQTLWYPPAL